MQLVNNNGGKQNKGLLLRVKDKRLLKHYQLKNTHTHTHKKKKKKKVQNK